MTKHRDNQADYDGTDDDATVWKRLAKGVKRYWPDPPALARPKPSSRRRGSVVTPVARSVAGSVPVMPVNKKPDPVDLRVGEHAGIDKSTRRRLAQGQLAIESHLDLHGLNAAQAERRLFNFVNNATRQDHRCVLVITGKGVDGTGVLRRLVPHWLKSPPLASHILAISAARPADGGAGALYVLLRRRRQSS